MLARVESRAQEKGCRTSAPIVREGIAAPDPEKAGASPLLAACVPADATRAGTSGELPLSPRDLDRGQEPREHQHVAGRFWHRGEDHVLVVGAFDHADAAAGVVAGLIEGWSVQESIYFAFVSGLTIGYGDLAPKLLLSRTLAICIGLCGVLFTAILAAVAVKALTAAGEE